MGDPELEADLPEKGKQYATSKIARGKKIHLLNLQGMSMEMIAKRFRISPRYAYELKKAYLDHLEEPDISPDPRPASELAPELRPMLEFSADAFELFYNRYSGTMLHPRHKEWVRVALDNRLMLINVPPGHGKSTIFSVWVPIWLICRNRNVQILLVSATNDITKKFARVTCYHLQYNEQLIADWGRFKPDQDGIPWQPTSGVITVEGRDHSTKSGDLTMVVAGTGQAILGRRADWIILDDADAPDIARSEIKRQELESYFRDELMTRLEPGGHVTVIGQRIAANDLYGTLADDKALDGESSAWAHVNYPAILDWTAQEVLIEDLYDAEGRRSGGWTWDELMLKYNILGEARFECMYQQEPLPEGSRLVQRAWVIGDEYHPGCLDLDRGLGQSSRSALEPQAWRPTVRVMSLDPAQTRNGAIVVADVFKDVDHFECEVLEILAQPMHVRDMEAEIDRCWNTYRMDYLICEQVGAQRWLLQPGTSLILDRLRRSGLRVRGHNTGRNKADPTLGLQSLAVNFEFGQIRLPYGDAEARNSTEGLLKEAYAFPNGDTDDRLMALWFIRFAAPHLMTSEAWAQTDVAGGGFPVPPRLDTGYGWWKAG